MKKLITLSLAATLLAAPALGDKQEDLEKLKATNDCQKCNLSKADLSGANLSKAKINSANFTNAKLCNTVMPDGQSIFKDC